MPLERIIGGSGIVKSLAIAVFGAGVLASNVLRDIIVVNPNDPSAVETINDYAAQDGSEIYLSDGDLSTVDRLKLEKGELISISGNNVVFYGEGSESSLIERDECSKNNFVVNVTGSGSGIYGLSLLNAKGGVLYSGTNYGEATNFLEDVVINDMNVNGIQLNNYQRENTGVPALVVRNVFFDSIKVAGAEYREGEQLTTSSSSPYAHFENCTFVGEEGYGNVAVGMVLPYLWDEGRFLGEEGINNVACVNLDSCIVPPFENPSGGGEIDEGFRPCPKRPIPRFSKE